MFNQFEAGSYFKIGSSRRCLQVGCALHGMAVLACWLANIPVAVKWVMSLVIPALGWVYVYQRGQANIELRYTRTTGWQICLDGKDFWDITILKSTVVSNLAIFLHYRGKINPRFKAIMIANDSLSANDYRRLMVKLKIT
jgi:hypothetical protein